MCRQIRGGFGAVLGWDLSAGLALAQALGLNLFVVAELLPAVEAVAIRKINEHIRQARNE